MGRPVGVFPNSAKASKGREKEERSQRGRRVRAAKKTKNIAGRGIFNLSSKVSTDSEKAILDKGLKICPAQES